MNPILAGIDSVITTVSGVLYMPWVPLLLLSAGLVFTFRSRFIQLRLLRETFRVLSEKPRTEGGVASFGALMVSTASRVGTGNIVGVSTAICIGGYGAVFWMWITALLGGAMFAYLQGLLPLMVLLAVPGFLGWVLPYFCYQRLRRRREQQIAPLIEQKSDEIYTVCEQGCRLLHV